MVWYVTHAWSTVDLLVKINASLHRWKWGLPCPVAIISFLEAKGIGISEPSSSDGTEQPPLHRGTYHIAQVDCINALTGLNSAAVSSPQPELPPICHPSAICMMHLSAAACMWKWVDASIIYAVHETYLRYELCHIRWCWSIHQCFYTFYSLRDLTFAGLWRVRGTQL